MTARAKQSIGDAYVVLVDESGVTKEMVRIAEVAIERPTALGPGRRFT
jgi:hypothetical protein